MKRINKIIFSFILLFICINSLNAASSCGVTLTEESEADPAGFRVNMGGCYQYTFTGRFNELGPRDTWHSAREMAEIMLAGFYKSDDGKSMNKGYFPLCEGLGAGRAKITAEVHCYFYLTKSTKTSKKDSYQDTKSGLHTTKNIKYDTYTPDKKKAITCSDYTTKKSCSNNGCTVNMKYLVIFDYCSGDGAKCPDGYGHLSNGYCYKDCKSGYSYNSSSKTCSKELSCSSQYGSSYIKKNGVCYNTNGYCKDDGWTWKSSDDKCYSPWKCDKYNTTGKNYKLVSHGKNGCEWIHCPYEDDGTVKNVDNVDKNWNLTTIKGTQKCRLKVEQANFKDDDSLQYGEKWKSDVLKDKCELDAALKRVKTSSALVDDPCTCDIRYWYKCPIYECKKEVRTISVCTPKFKTNDNKRAYCLNPNDPFSTSYGNKAQYQIDTSFNVRSCASSYSTIDCGYGNILIEGAYLKKIYGNNKVSDNAIELALRLWGAHTGRKGFNQYGISIKYRPGCSSRAGYMKWNTTTIPNVYKVTYNQIMKDFAAKKFESIKNTDYFNAYTQSGIFSYVCDSTGDERYQTERTLKPTANQVNTIGLICRNSGEDKSVYQQAIGLFFNTLLGNKYMQTHLTELYGGQLAVAPEGAYYKTDASGSYVEVKFNENEFNEAFKTYSKGEVINCNTLSKSDPNYNKIAPYCQVRVELYNSSGVVLVGSNRMDECVAKTASCRRRVTTKAICDIENVNQRPSSIKVTNEKSKSSYAVRKYIACSNADKSQILFAFGDNPGGTAGVSNINTINDPETNVFNITNYICSGSCGNHNVRNNMKKECPKTGTVYGNVYKSSVKDPSLNCIMNMNTMAGKEMYDYSDHFKVNKNLCRIYCSDEIEYYVADKVKAVSGRTFKYDIEMKVNGTKKVAYPLSSMIKERRTCVSQIFYNNSMPDSSDLVKTYGFTSAQAGNIHNFNQLFDALVEKANNEGGRAENINQIIYDLYNCNLYANNVFTDNKVIKPKESKTGNLRENILVQYGASNNYGLVASGDCTIDVSRGINTCIKEKDIVYNWGVAPEGNRVKIKSTQTVQTTYNNLTYCTGSDCFKYDKNNDATSYVYPKSTDAPRTNRIIGNKTANKSLNVGNDTTRSKLKQWFGKDSVMVPTNDYALFEIITDVNFYNASEFQSLPQDDGVICKGSRVGSFIDLDKYSYPISKNAYNTCERVNEEISRCAITQEFETVATFYRKNVYDDFTTIVANSKKFTCYVDVIQPVPPLTESPAVPSCSEEPCYVGTRYRNVDTADLFPRYSRLPNSWNTTEGRAAKAEIEATSSQLKTTDNLLEYRITLTPTQLKNLNDYARTGPAYQKEPVTGCSVSGDIYVNCKSTLLNTMRNDASNKYGTFDPNYKYGISTYTKNKH